MRRALVLLLLLPALAAAQSYDGFDGCGYAGINGLRLYFDETVDTGCEGVLMNPAFFARSATQFVTAWLVLTTPTGQAMAGWQADLSIFGQGAVTGSTLLGAGAVNSGAGDTYLVSFPAPLPLDTVHNPLVSFDLVLQPGDIPWGLLWGRMEFWLAPAAGRPEADPGYTRADGAFVACHSLNSDFHGWGTVPYMLLNDLFGVTDAEPATFGGVKALYR